MADNIMDIGEMENNTEKVYFLHQMKINGKKECGMREKELDGLHQIKLS